MNALDAALRRALVKFFPASAASGPALIRAIAAPYAHTPLRLVPLGGVNDQNMVDYLQLPLVSAVGGSWLTERELAATGQWEQISALTRRALQLAAGAKCPETN